MTRIGRLLVANRGEIARRIFRTAREMGIGTVAVHADPDAAAPFVREADVAVALGGSTSAETYLDIEKLIAAAKRADADAVHPGYGFLSERADFAGAVMAAGLTWVGPHAEAIAAMGHKLAAKEQMAAAGVPVLPSADVMGLSVEELAVRAAAIGYPLLVKASEGGGGRGMRIVSGPDTLAGAIESARRESLGAFGSEQVFIEKYLQRARHVEVQILGDRYGHLIHCFERECSIQRRHQKVIEEAPSPAVTPQLRQRLGAAAVAAGRAIGYDSAGTVEFLLGDDGTFSFLEMNTRLQVEHPVTEAITGLDLVRSQIRIAEGERLALRQDDLHIMGHAIEVRLYAEDPERDFLPAAGRVLAFVPPKDPPSRFDSGVESGSDVPIAFDPMLAKVIVDAPTRTEAALRLATVLERTQVAGLTTNRDFLVNVLRHEAFLAGDTTTDFIDRVAPARGRPPTAERLRVAATAAALAGQVERRAAAKVLASLPSGWRNNPSQPQRVGFASSNGPLVTEYQHRRDGSFATSVDGEPGTARLASLGEGGLELEIDGLRRGLRFVRDGTVWYVHDGEGDIRLDEEPRFPPAASAALAGGYEAPMPGKVVSIHVAEGEQVSEGQLLLVLEAMKMEHHIICLAAGTVRELRVAPGTQVDGGAVLVLIESGEG